MNKLTLLLVLLCNVCLLSAQNVDKKYLAGAVPEEDGKIIMKRTVKVDTSISHQDLFNTVDEWAQEVYGVHTNTNRRVALVDPSASYIACIGFDTLLFKQSFLSVDRAMMRYQLVAQVENGSVVLDFRNIKYDYSDYKTPVVAEELIVDKEALHKSGEKLNRYYDKFRIFTIDRVDELANSLSAAITAKYAVQPVAPTPPPAASVAATVVSAVPSEPVYAPSAPPASAPRTSVTAVPVTVSTVAATPANTLAGYQRIDADKIPGNIIKLLENDWSLITSGKGDNVNVMTASWGGLGRFWDKPMAMSFINPTRHSITTMDDGETYTISFYTEMHRDKMQYCGSVSGKNADKIKGSGLTPVKTPSGATVFAEAWMVIECRKVLAQPISESAVLDKDLSKEWSKDGYHKMYVGEILNVWVR